MKIRISRALVFEGLMLGLAVLLSIGAIWMLFQLNRGLTTSQEIYDYNLPSFSVKAEYELARLESTLNEYIVGTASADNIQLRYDILLARLSHYESAFIAINHRAEKNVGDLIDNLLLMLLSMEESIFALQEGDRESALKYATDLKQMYGPIEELTTLTREAHNRNLEILTNSHTRGVRVGFALIVASVLIGTLLATYFWYNLKEKIKFNQDLEKQIHERTEDLQISNVSLKQEIEERQRAEKALAERENQIHRVQKMEAVGRVTSGVAHDFNNLLAVIMGNIELLMSSEDKVLSEKYMDNAMAATAMGSQLTKKLLAFGRRAPLKSETVNINRIILDIDDLLLHTLPEKIRLEMSLADDVWPISVDRSLLENVLLNLVINARDALRDGGCITVNTANINKNNDQSDVVGEFVCVSVSDEGTGMTLEVLDQAFEPFFSTKTESEGSGLGLSMASGFVQQSKGYIKVDSAPGKGTCVQLLFPRCFTEPESNLSKPSNELKNEFNTRRILVVEDLATVRQVVVEQLRVLGYDTVEASNGSSALEQIKTDGSINILLSDVVMPGNIQGLELANRAKKLRPDLKILIMSGYPNDSQESRHELECGFNKLMKPVRMEELSRALNEEFEDSVIRSSDVELAE